MFSTLKVHFLFCYITFLITFFPLKTCIRGIFLPFPGLLEDISFTFRPVKQLSMLEILFPLNFVDTALLISPFIVINKSTTHLILICLFFLWT